MRDRRAHVGIGEAGGGGAVDERDEAMHNRLRMNDDGEIRYVRLETDWHNETDSDDAFYLRVYGVNEYRYPGADMGVLLVRDRMQTADRQLVPKAAQWAKAIMSKFAGVPVAAHIAQPEELLYAKWM